MEQLTGVFLDVDTGYADALGIAFLVHDDVQMTMLAQWNIILGNLIGLGQVGIHVVFPIHFGNGVDGAVGDQAGHDGVPHGLAVQLGQGAGQADADGAAVGVGLATEGGGAPAENLGGGGQLDMGFQAPDHFILPAHRATPPSTADRIGPAACSY